MKSPITFREWLCIAGIVLLFGTSFLLLEQIPFVDNFLDKVSDFLQIQGESIN